jgi:hypothetical protein
LPTKSVPTSSAAWATEPSVPLHSSGLGGPGWKQRRSLSPAKASKAEARLLHRERWRGGSQCSFRWSGVRGDRSDTDASSDRCAPGGPLAVESTLVPESELFFAEGFRNEGLDRWQFGREGSPGLALGAPVTIGCTVGAEEGNSRNNPRSASPSLGLPAHAARATGRRRRKTSSRWMVGAHNRVRQAPNGGKANPG